MIRILIILMIIFKRKVNSIFFLRGQDLSHTFALESVTLNLFPNLPTHYISLELDYMNQAKISQIF